MKEEKKYEFTDVQKKIITTNESQVLVLSSAASGKSAVIVERIRYLLDQGVDPSKIVAITFTNNAASVMFERLGQPDGLFIGTVHSYCNYLLRSGAIDTSKILNEERFDDLFEEIKKNPNRIQPVEHLLLDEAQDSTKAQFEFFELINPDNYMYVGDIKQTIFTFNGSYPDYLVELMHNPDVTIYKMNQNFRNQSDILRYAKKFLYRLGPDYEDTSIAMRQSDDEPFHVIEADLSIESAAAALVHYKTKKNLNWNDWFVLCRTNQDITEFIKIFNQMGVPVDTFKQAELTNAQIKDRMEDDTIKVLTVHSAKGLESKCVLAYNVRAFNDEHARLCYVAATRAKDFLLWIKCPPKKKKKAKTMNWE